MRKMYAVEKVKKEIDIIKMCYAFLNMKMIHLPEVTFMNKDFSKAGMQGMFLTYTKDCIPSWVEFYREYKERKAGISCVAAFDLGDTDRVTLMYVPAEDIKKGEIHFVASMDCDDSMRDKFFAELFNEFEKIGN